MIEVPFNPITCLTLNGTPSKGYLSKLISPEAHNRSISLAS